MRSDNALGQAFQGLIMIATITASLAFLAGLTLGWYLG